MKEEVIYYYVRGQGWVPKLEKVGFKLSDVTRQASKSANFGFAGVLNTTATPPNLEQVFGRVVRNNQNLNRPPTNLNFNRNTYTALGDAAEAFWYGAYGQRRR